MHSSTFGKGWVGMSACPSVVLACESLHVCTVCIWRCEHARFCVEVFYALYIFSFIHSSSLQCHQKWRAFKLQCHTLGHVHKPNPPTLWNACTIPWSMSVTPQYPAGQCYNQHHTVLIYFTTNPHIISILQLFLYAYNSLQHCEIISFSRHAALRYYYLWGTTFNKFSRS